MICPACNDHEIGEGPWESWFRCANCDIHPDTAILIRDQRHKIGILERQVSDLQRKVDRQSEEITRLAASRDGLRRELRLVRTESVDEKVARLSHQKSLTEDEREFLAHYNR